MSEADNSRKLTQTSLPALQKQLLAIIESR